MESPLHPPSSLFHCLSLFLRPSLLPRSSTKPALSVSSFPRSPKAHLFTPLTEVQLPSVSHLFPFESSNILNCTNSLTYLFLCTYPVYPTRLGVLQCSVLSHLLIFLCNNSLGESSSTCKIPWMPHVVVSLSPCSGYPWP